MIRALVATFALASTLASAPASACSFTPFGLLANEVIAVTKSAAQFEVQDAILLAVEKSETTHSTYIVRVGLPAGGRYESLYRVRWEPNEDPNGPVCPHPVATKVMN